jgi:uncharacterized RDD family membrane protein YckC
MARGSGYEADVRSSGPDDDWRGRGLGLPRTGPGSVAGTGRRALAFAIDAIASALIAALFIPDFDSPARGLLGAGVLTLEYLVLVSLTGQTFGMRLLGLSVRWLRSAQRPPPFQPTALRTALLVLLVPALITDRDSRGLHDKAAGTVVVRAS